MESIITETIHNTLSMEQVALFYQPNPIKKGFVLCPMHGEKTPSLRIYKNTFFCFGCQTGGDVIRFVQHLFNIDFKSAIVRLDYDFNLNLGLGKKLSLEEKRERQKQTRAIQKKQLEEQAKQYKWEQIYKNLLKGWCRLDMNYKQYAPKSQNEALHPLFVEAIQNLEYVAYLLDSHIGDR